MKFPCFDVGWVYIAAGLLLTIAAILVPAMDELQTLNHRKAEVQSAECRLNHQRNLYVDFANQLKSPNQTLQDRIRQMQLNVTPDATPVVFDPAASTTPLQWIDQRVKVLQRIETTQPNQSLLHSLSKGNGRLWLAGGGVFVIFLGCVLTSE